MFLATLSLVGVLCLPPHMGEVKKFDFVSCETPYPMALLCKTHDGVEVGINLVSNDVRYVDEHPEDLDQPSFFRESGDSCEWKKHYAPGHGPKES